MTAQKKSSHKNAARSRQMIKTAFAELLNEKEMAKITVTNIVDRAGISRGTFYAHYLDVYDLFMAVQANIAETIENGITAIGAENIIKDPTAAIAAGMKFLDTKKAYYKLFATCSLSAVFIEKVMALVEQKLYDAAEELFDGEKEQEYTFFMTYSLGAAKNVVISWLTGKLDVPAARIAEMITELYLRSKPGFFAEDSKEAAAE